MWTCPSGAADSPRSRAPPRCASRAKARAVRAGRGQEEDSQASELSAAASPPQARNLVPRALDPADRPSRVLRAEPTPGGGSSDAPHHNRKLPGLRRATARAARRRGGWASEPVPGSMTTLTSSRRADRSYDACTRAGRWPADKRATAPSGAAQVACRCIALAGLADVPRPRGVNDSQADTITTGTR